MRIIYYFFIGTIAILDKVSFILNLQILGLMRTLTAASKYGSKMYSRMTLKDILVVNQWVGLYGSGNEEYFEYIPGICLLLDNCCFVISRPLKLYIAHL